MSEGTTKLIVNLVQDAVDALISAVAITELSRTDTVNRALQIYNRMLIHTFENDDKELVLKVDLFGDDRWFEIEIREVV